MSSEPNALLFYGFNLDRRRGLPFPGIEGAFAEWLAGLDNAVAFSGVSQDWYGDARGSACMHSYVYTRRHEVGMGVADLISIARPTDDEIAMLMALRRRLDHEDFHIGWHLAAGRA